MGTKPPFFKLWLKSRFYLVQLDCRPRSPDSYKKTHHHRRFLFRYVLFGRSQKKRHQTTRAARTPAIIKTRRVNAICCTYSWHISRVHPSRPHPWDCQLAGSRAGKVSKSPGSGSGRVRRSSFFLSRIGGGGVSPLPDRIGLDPTREA